MASLMKLADSKVHTREIKISTYGAGEDRIVVEGSLADDRLQEYFLLSGEKRKPGRVHHMVVRILVEGRSLVIRDVEVVMKSYPREGCDRLASCLRPIVGMSITAGFTNKVKSLVGGVNGCFHVMSLLLAMAPAAVQGYWSHRSSRPVSADSVPPSERLKFLPVNSCHVWREDGPLVQRMKKELGVP